MTDLDPTLDLVLEREIDVPVHLVWAAWTQPEHIVHWFTPAPYGTESAEVDLRPGGIFRIVMTTPEGDLMDQGAGCILEVVENERFTWTAALGPGYRPTPGEMPFTATILLEEIPGGTRYTAIARHANPEDAAKHAEMGFTDGWGAALDQLVAYTKTR
jgi:uncharacterized protein YndB with AHSA1/START domain